MLQDTSLTTQDLPPAKSALQDRPHLLDPPAATTVLRTLAVPQVTTTVQVAALHAMLDFTQALLDRAFAPSAQLENLHLPRLPPTAPFALQVTSPATLHHLHALYAKLESTLVPPEILSATLVLLD